MVRFAARAQQPAALNDVIEATTSEFGTNRTHRTGQMMSVDRGRPEMISRPPKRRF